MPICYIKLIEQGHLLANEKHAQIQFGNKALAFLSWNAYKFSVAPK